MKGAALKMVWNCGGTATPVTSTPSATLAAAASGSAARSRTTAWRAWNTPSKAAWTVTAQSDWAVAFVSLRRRAAPRVDAYEARVEVALVETVTAICSSGTEYSFPPMVTVRTACTARLIASGSGGDASSWRTATANTAK